MYAPLAGDRACRTRARCQDSIASLGILPGHRPRGWYTPSGVLRFMFSFCCRRRDRNLVIRVIKSRKDHRASASPKRLSHHTTSQGASSIDDEFITTARYKLLMLLESTNYYERSSLKKLYLLDCRLCTHSTRNARPDRLSRDLHNAENVKITCHRVDIFFVRQLS